MFVIAAVLVMTSLPFQAARASKAITYQHPLAYIGWDENVWVTDLNSGPGTPLTKDGRFESPYSSYGNPSYSRDDPNSHLYKDIQWSPTDSIFGVYYHDLAAGEYGEYLFASGHPPIHPDTIKGELQGVWSVDGKAFVKLDVGSAISLNDHDDETCHTKSLPSVSKFSVSLQKTSIDSGATSTLWIGQQCALALIGNGPAPTLAEYLLAREHNTEAYMFVEPAIKLMRTEASYLSNVGDSFEMIGFDGKSLWGGNYLTLQTSPDGRFAFAITDGEPDERYPVLIELSSGKEMKLPFSIPDDIYASALTKDNKTLVYSTVKKNADYNLWDTNTVSLWSIPITGGTPRQLFARTGRGVGRILPTPDDQGVVVSFITSRAVTRAKNIPFLPAGTGHAELLYVDLQSGAIKLLAIGGQPAFGKQPFTAIPAE
jgi:hypothetical protein